MDKPVHDQDKITTLLHIATHAKLVSGLRKQIAATDDRERVAFLTGALNVFQASLDEIVDAFCDEAGVPPMPDFDKF